MRAAGTLLNVPRVQNGSGAVSELAGGADAKLHKVGGPTHCELGRLLLHLRSRAPRPI